MQNLYKLLIVVFVFLGGNYAHAQKATLKGTLSDKTTKETLIQATIIIRGTQYGGKTNFDGEYLITDIKPGTYDIEFRYLGYKNKLYTGIKLAANEEKVLNVALEEESGMLGSTEIIGEPPLIEFEKPVSKFDITGEKIDAAPARQIEQILATQPGIINSPAGLHIRGSRSYETGFFIDDVSAKDPLAGTGFGLDVGSNFIDNIEVSTSGAGVEYGNNTGGVINTQTKNGSDSLQGKFMYKRDNFGFNEDWNSVWNQQVFEGSLSGPLTKNRKLKYFVSGRFNLSDNFFKQPADQVESSLFPNDIEVLGQKVGERYLFSPLQDNKWSTMLKLNYLINDKMSISGSYLRSLTINQDLNLLRITTADVPYNPGYQYPFYEQPDNANTFTHDMNLQTIKFDHYVNDRFSYKAIASRMFVHLRADANGRPWRPEVVNTEFDPRSVNEYPVTYFDPNDSVTFVENPSGFYNNNGIATLWHDHIVEENTIQLRGTYKSKDALNRINFGTELKSQYLQWVDIVRPWIGAPVQISDTSFSQSFRLGDRSDAWTVRPINGAFYIADQLRYLGLIADIGLRAEYWFLGKFVDDAIENPDAPILEEFRQDYKNNSFKLGNRYFKARLLPKVAASFPIQENQVVFFNYRHSTVMAHPSFIYTGLDPFYQDRSVASFVGNPNLNPEVDISYEIGIKSQISTNDALNITAFWKDKYDFITTSSVIIPDPNGRDIVRSIRINGDYARTRGIEVVYLKRIKRWFAGQVSGSYSVATGQSASANEALNDVLLVGNTEYTREFFLPWDNPIDLKFNAIFTQADKNGLWQVKGLNNMRFYAEGTFRTGRRYTPYVFEGNEEFSGRPIWVQNNDPNERYSELGTPWFYVDMNFSKWWNLGNGVKLSYLIEVTNVFNNKNAVIVNPVTGRAYEYGDPVPDTQRDLRYNDPRDPRSRQISPENPARYLPFRHFLTGFALSF